MSSEHPPTFSKVFGGKSSDGLGGGVALSAFLHLAAALVAWTLVDTVPKAEVSWVNLLGGGSPGGGRGVARRTEFSFQRGSAAALPKVSRKILAPSELALPAKDKAQAPEPVAAPSVVGVATNAAGTGGGGSGHGEGNGHGSGTGAGHGTGRGGEGILPLPEYPAAARRMGLEGVVHARVWLDAEGRADRIEILEGSGHRLLDDAVVKTLQRWRLPADIKVQGALEKKFEFRLRQG